MGEKWYIYTVNETVILQLTMEKAFYEINKIIEEGILSPCHRSWSKDRYATEVDVGSWKKLLPCSKGELFMNDICEHCGKEKHCISMDVEWTLYSLLCEDCRDEIYEEICK